MSARTYRISKRTFDIIYASAGILASLLPLAAVAFAVKASSPGPIFFRQTRVGRNGLPFTCYKIRTMRCGTPQCAASKLGDPSRFLTPIGALLRSYSIDELPQLLNVLRGDMSFIGPRPLIPNEREVHRLRSERGVYAMRPGISGLSQIIGRDGMDDRRKAEFDALYAKNASLWLDLAIIKRTSRCIRH